MKIHALYPIEDFPPPIGPIPVSGLLTSNWLNVLAGAAMLACAIAGFSAIRATVTAARAKKHGCGTSAELTEDAKGARGAFGALIMLGGVIVGIAAAVTTYT